MEEKKEIFIVWNMPEYPGGELALMKHIDYLINYPQEAIDKEITGNVYVNFVVGTDGKIKNTRITRGVHPSLDKEALRVVNSLSRWKPGMQAGLPIEVSYTFRFDFLPENKIDWEWVNASPVSD